MIVENQVSAVHDVSDGGLIVTIAEMALAGGIGADLVYAPWSSGPYTEEAWFAEDQGLYVVTTSDLDRLQRVTFKANFSFELLGFTEGETIRWKTRKDVSLADLRAAHEGFFPALMGADGALA